MRADIVVIGAGAFGLSAALHCALRGRSVVVVERETAGSQASGRAAGLFKSVQADELRTRLRPGLGRVLSAHGLAARQRAVSSALMDFCQNISAPGRRLVLASRRRAT